VLVLLGALVEEVPPEREPGGVDEDVDAGQLFAGGLDEELAADWIRDVQLQRRYRRLDPVAARRAPPTTRAPSRARASAVAAPMPLDAPVTTADLPSRLDTARA